MSEPVTPRLLSTRAGLRSHRFYSVRCAVCYRRFWPWQRRTGGANYFRHPWMDCHPACGLAEEKRLRGE